MNQWEVICGDAVDVLRGFPNGGFQSVITSPPYWGLRDYGIDGQLGLEPTPEAYVDRLVEIFREVRRVLSDDGTVWLVIGDSYAGSGKGGNPEGSPWAGFVGNKDRELSAQAHQSAGKAPPGLKPKDLCMIPARVAMALQADGWWLRSDTIWSKPNPMPESVTDRPTKAHEYIFLLTKSERYFYDADAIREENTAGTLERLASGPVQALSDNPKLSEYRQDGRKDGYLEAAGRNKRSVWTIATEPYPEAHFAVYPTKLIEPCVLAGTSAKGQCPECGKPWERVVERENGYGKRRCVGGESGQQIHPPGVSHDLDGPQTRTIGWQPTCDCGTDPEPQTILDPFCGSGTTGVVTLRHGRNFVGIDLNPWYCEMARNRIDADCPLFNRQLTETTR